MARRPRQVIPQRPRRGRPPTPPAHDGAAVAVVAGLSVLILLILVVAVSSGRRTVGAASAEVAQQLPTVQSAPHAVHTTPTDAPARTVIPALPEPVAAPIVVKPPVAEPAVTKILRPWRDDPLARHPRGDGDFRVATGSAIIATTMSRLPTVRCEWLIPLGLDGGPLATAADVVALFPYPTENDPLGSSHARDLARRYGFTVMTIIFPDMAQADGKDRSQYYYFPESGSGQAWLDGWRQVCAAAGLPERRLLLFGRSGGGSAAHLFAEAYPEAVEAYAEEAGRVFVERPRCLVPVLILHGEFDYTLAPTLAFDRALRATGVEALRVSFRPTWDLRGAVKGLLTHAMHAEHFRLMQDWLAGVADLRLANAGTLPPTSKWPSFAGRPFPDAAAYAAFRTTAPPLERIGHAVLARPAPTIVAKGLVLLMVDEFSVDPLDVIFDAQMLADDGFVCAAASSDLTDPAAALIAALPTADPSGRLPIVVAVQGRTRHLAALLTACGSRLRGCAAMRQRTPDVTRARLALGAKHQLLVLASATEAKALGLGKENGVEVMELKPNGTSDGRVHLDRIQRLSERSRRWVGEAGDVQ